MTIDCINEKLKKILTPKRYIHSVNVMHTSVELAQRYGGKKEDAALAGLLHDCARDLSGSEVLRLCKKYDIITDDITMLQPKLLHGRLGAFIARDEFGVAGHEIQEAVACHTMGCRNMSLLDKIVFIADYIEPARDYPGVDIIRKAAFENLERAMILGIDSTIGYILEKGSPLHPDTVDTRNWLIMQDRSLKENL